MLSSMELKSPSSLVVMVFVMQNGSPLVRRGKTMVTWPPSYPVTYLCTGKYIRALKNMFVPEK